MDRSLRFGSRWCNSIALFGLAFATATALALTSLHHANSQAHSSKGTLSPFTRKSSNGLYAHGFRYYFTPLPGYFSPFPHGTSALSVARVVLSLTRWSSQIHTEFPGSRATWGHRKETKYFSRTGLLPSAVRISITVPLSIGFVTPWKVCCPSERAPQPRCSIASRLYHYNGLG